jgi:GTP-binding protein Era
MVQEFKVGFVAVVGRPNAGKSTLINHFLQQKVAAVSPRPQTTRRRQLGILSLEHAQIIFEDTPGIHEPLHKLGEFMNTVAEDTIRNCDVVLWLLSGDEAPTREDKRIAAFLKRARISQLVILVINKIDVKEPSAERRKEFSDLFLEGEVAEISALTGKNCDTLLERIIQYLPPGEALYDTGQVTDLYEREIAADLIREAALMELREEIPHGIAIRVDDFKERSDNLAYINAVLIVEKESHKGIVIGKQGSMLKRIGSRARAEIESMSGRKIYLELRVKVQKNWRNDTTILRSLGYSKDEEK